MITPKLPHNNLGKVFALISCFLWLSCHHCVPQDTSPTSSNTQPPAIVVQDAAFTGEIVHLGEPSPGATDMAVFHDIKIKVAQILGGTINPEPTGTLTVSYEMEMHEQPPVEGNSYVFLVHKGKVKIRVSKLLPATDANIAKIKALLADASSAK